MKFLFSTNGNMQEFIYSFPLSMTESFIQIPKIAANLLSERKIFYLQPNHQWKCLLYVMSFVEICRLMSGNFSHFISVDILLTKKVFGRKRFLSFLHKQEIMKKNINICCLYIFGLIFGVIPCIISQGKRHLLLPTNKFAMMKVYFIFFVVIYLNITMRISRMNKQTKRKLWSGIVELKLFSIQFL